MKLKAFVIGSGALLGVSVMAPIARAADTGEAEAPANDANLRDVTIKVKSVDRAHHMVTFTAQISPEAKFEKEGQPIKIDRLRAGDEVRAAFDPSSGEVMKIEIQRSAGMAK